MLYKLLISPEIFEQYQTISACLSVFLSFCVCVCMCVCVLVQDLYTYCVFLNCSITHKDSWLRYWDKNLKEHQRSTSCPFLHTFQVWDYKISKSLPTPTAVASLAIFLASLWLLPVSRSLVPPPGKRLTLLTQS